MATPSSTLLRQLFPSWEFFDVARLPPSLEVRRLPTGGTPGPWCAAVRPAPRRWWHVLFNPEGTRTLAAQTLVERWCTELIEGGDASDIGRESLALITALAQEALSDEGLSDARPSERWQLRLVVVDDEDDTMEILYESNPLAWGLPGVTS